MKVEITTRIVADFSDMLENAPSSFGIFSDLVIKNMTLASIANQMEITFQALLVKSPEVLIAEVTDIREVEND